MSDTVPSPTFAELGLPDFILKALDAVGYETPSPIQQRSIPALLKKRDLLGLAQTGTGKTAAFALPLLANVDTRQKHIQILVLAPTRELAIQVAEACQTYSRFLKDFHVVPIYGGQSYTQQLRALQRGVQMVVGTPGRVMDHMRRGTLKLDQLQTLVLDEADEMLRMGFIDDVEWILDHTPAEHQIALFSATMPRQISKIADRYLTDPEIVRIESKTSTASTIRQRYWMVNGLHKLDALSRVLEAEPTDGVMIFVRTKSATEELAEKLNARGYVAAAIHGDIQQKTRERIVEQLRKGKVDILVATDVAARGLDVERISHVINYDIPYDTESYVHRIGRTGRAGRSGDAILFVARRERRMLGMIEKAIGRQIDPLTLPSAADINKQRMARFQQHILDTLAQANLQPFTDLLADFQQQHPDLDIETIAAALAYMAQGDQPLLLDEARDAQLMRDSEQQRPSRREKARQEGRDKTPSGRTRQAPPENKLVTPGKPLRDHPEVQLERYWIAVGHAHQVRPQDIVGAIANEADINSSYIGQIEIYEDFSTVDLPADMPKALMRVLGKARVKQQALAICKAEDRPRHRSKSAAGPATPAASAKKGKPVNKPKKAGDKPKNSAKRKPKKSD